MRTVATLHLLLLIGFISACEPSSNGDPTKHPNAHRHHGDDAAGTLDDTSIPLADQVEAVRAGESSRIRVSGVTDSQVADVVQLAGLELLKIDSPHLTDRSLAVIGKSRSLRFVILHNAAVTDAGLLQLKDMEQLESLYLFNTRVTDQGVAALAEQLPRLHLHW